MKKILFATTNHRKIGEARLACLPFGIEIEPVQLHIEEIQSHDPMLIGKRKAEEAFTQLNQPVVVTDTFWSIPAVNGFPGGYMKDIVDWFESGDFINLVKNKSDQRVAFTESIFFKDAKQLKIFSKEYWGKLIDPPRGSGNSIENVAEFDGFTLGERRAQGGYSHKPEDYIWSDFAKWFATLT